jgi:putative transposase
MFRHKNIRLPLDRYVGTVWFFVTFCCENRKRIFLDPTRAKWFLDNLRPNALAHNIAIHTYCIMPDHIHLLSQGLTPTSDLLRSLTALKKRTGFTYKQETSQQLWQKKSYDHALRSSDPPDLVAWYICMNPVRAGLCTSVNDYPWSGSLTGPRPVLRQTNLGRHPGASRRRQSKDRRYVTPVDFIYIHLAPAQKAALR